MDCSNVKVYILLLFISVLNIEANPGIEKYQKHHSKAFQRNDPKPSGKLLPPGRCMKEVPVAHVARGSFHPVGNSSNPEFSIISVCCDGYREVVGGICEPICEKPCRNGICRRPNECICLDGYVMSLANECVNICPFGCLNGYCDIYENCICKPGYAPDQSQTFCQPICSQNCGINGNCTAPNICGCNKGYGFNIYTGFCEPQCYPQCGAGRCVLPGKCECNQGYILKDGTCQTNCTRGCENGRCVAPEVCSCDAGWQLGPYQNKCEPVCENGCPSGVCIGPNKCKCIEGYQKLSPSSNVCNPVCKRGCFLGECVAPDICRCKPGYVLNSSGNRCKKVSIRSPNPIPSPPTQLQPPVIPMPMFQTTMFSSPPQCLPNCINSHCISSNHCSCYTGYVQDPGHSYICNPYCVNKCINGTCVSPNVCNCNSGFEKSANGCVPKKISVTTPRSGCNKPCVNSRCMGNKCECNYGFIKDPKDKFICIPYCTGGCINATCVAPNICQCLPGFNKKSNNVCEKVIPRCDKQCLNGKCVGRNQCQCNPGYAAKSGVYNICTPVCQGGCPNGRCEQPNKCICNYGYIMKHNICIRQNHQ